MTTQRTAPRINTTATHATFCLNCLTVFSTIFHVFGDLFDVNERFNILNVFENITNTRFDSIFNGEPLSPTQYPTTLREPCPTYPTPHPTSTTPELGIVVPEFNGCYIVKEGLNNIFNSCNELIKDLHLVCIYYFKKLIVFSCFYPNMLEKHDVLFV